MAEHGSSLIRTLHEVALYPPHPPRQATKLYTQNHHKIVAEQDRGCYICHVRNSDLQDPKRRDDPAINPVAAKQIETHHTYCEDSLADAVSLDYFNKHIRPGLMREATAPGRSGDAEQYNHEFTQDEMLEWIHGGYDNLTPYCDVHHRHPLVGIHAITGPIFGVQDWLTPGYDLTGYHATSPHEAAQLTALPQTTGTASAPPAQPEPAP